MDIFEDLLGRGLIKQSTDHNHIKLLINGNDPITFYIGFDPTADSLHVGHLLQLITAKRLKDAGHNPIMLIGGATALIGDPTGKTEMRKMLSHYDIRVNAEAIISQIKNIIKTDVTISNNLEWFDDVSFLTLLRTIGPYFSVNNMLRAECFKSRMENGLSFLEFNYMIMQAEDFRMLHASEKCILQIGGDDQWSNILAGIDLIHKKSGDKVFGLTLPLLVNSSGQKMGKTENGAVWLDETKTSIFDFFQFWRNVPDTDVKKLLNMLTLKSIEEINSIPFSTIDEINAAKQILAFEITKIVHGFHKATLTLNQAKTLFEDNDLSSIENVSITDNTNVLALIIKANFAKSKTEARNLIKNRGIIINDEVIEDPLLLINSQKFGKIINLRKGKKNFFRFNIEDQ